MLCTSGSDVGGDSDAGGGGVDVSRRVRSSQPSEAATAATAEAAATSTPTPTAAFEDVDGTLAASIAVGRASTTETAAATLAY